MATSALRAGADFDLAESGIRRDAGDSFLSTAPFFPEAGEVGAGVSLELRVLELLESCRAMLGVRRRVIVLAATGLNTPAIFGIAKPRLLVPAGMLQNLDDRELRHVFLHELIHLQRGDLLVNWAMIIIRALHWFNPAVWFAFRRLRAEQELACDAAVMARLAADERRHYGRTLLKLLDDFSPGTLCPGLVPFITTKQLIKRRITMISNFKPAGRLAAALSVVLLLALGSLTFTRAAEETKPTADDRGNSPPLTGPGSQSTMLTVQPGGGVLVVTIDKDGIIRIGSDPKPVEPSAVGRVLKSAIDGNGNRVIELHIDEAANDVTPQFASIMTALKEANVPVIKLTTGQVIDGTNITAMIRTGRWAKCDDSDRGRTGVWPMRWEAIKSLMQGASGRGGGHPGPSPDAGCDTTGASPESGRRAILPGAESDAADRRDVAARREHCQGWHHPCGCRHLAGKPCAA